MDAAKKKGLQYGICLILSLFLLFLVAGAQPVKAYQTTIDINGKTFYLFNDYLRSQDVNNCRLYMKTNYGSQLVAGMNYDRNAGMTYSMSYGKKLYFCVEESGFYYNTYSYTIGQRGFQKERNGLKLIDRRGKYAIAYTHETTDVGPNRYCLYNLSSKKYQYLGYGYGITFIGKQVYYVKTSKDMKQAQVIRCSYNGSNKKVLKKLKNSWKMSSFRFLSAHKVQYYISTYYNWQYMNKVKTVTF